MGFASETISALLDSQSVLHIANSPHGRCHVFCSSFLIARANDTIERYLTTGHAHVDVCCVNEWVGSQAVAHVFMNARVAASVVLGAVTGEAARSRLRKSAGEATLGWRQWPRLRTISGIGGHVGPLTSRDGIASF
jgi:hypothetical protein